MNIAKRDLPTGENTWHHTLAGGRVLIAVLVRYYREPYFFQSTRALLQALQHLKCVRPDSYHCATYMQGMDHK